MKLTVTAKKLAANRLNARKSRGPITPEGKRRSALNASRHALLAHSVLVEGESREHFLSLMNSLYLEFSPQTTAERACVDKIAIAQWRSLRYVTIQTADLSHEIRLQADETAHQDPGTRAMLAMRAIGERGGFDLTLLEHRADRQMQHALVALERLQRKRLKNGVASHDVYEYIDLPETNDPTPDATEPTSEYIDPMPFLPDFS